MDPANALWNARVFAKLARINKQILETKTEVLNATDEIKSKLDEEILRDFRTAFRHLRDATLSSVSNIQNYELIAARNKFAELVELHPDDTTKGTSGEFSNRYLIALGYLGNFHYYNLSGDKRMAAVQVYECISKFLEWNDHIKVVEAFSIDTLEGFFSREYLKEIGGAESSLAIAHKGLKEVEKESFQKKLRTLGIVSASTVGTVVAADVLLLSLPLLATAGVAGWFFGDKIPSAFKEKVSKETKDGFGRLKNVFTLPNIQEKKNSTAQLEKLIEDLKFAFESECSERLAHLQSTDSIELMVLDFDTSASPVTNQIEDLVKKNFTILSESSKATLEEEKNNLTHAIQQGDPNLVGKTLASLTTLLRDPACLTDLVEGYSSLIEASYELLDNCNNLIGKLQDIGVLEVH